MNGPKPRSLANLAEILKALESPAWIEAGSPAIDRAILRHRLRNGTPRTPRELAWRLALFLFDIKRDGDPLRTFPIHDFKAYAIRVNRLLRRRYNPRGLMAAHQLVRTEGHRGYRQVLQDLGEAYAEESQAAALGPLVDNLWSTLSPYERELLAKLFLDRYRKILPRDQRNRNPVRIMVALPSLLKQLPYLMYRFRHPPSLRQ